MEHFTGRDYLFYVSSLAAVQLISAPNTLQSTFESEMIVILIQHISLLLTCYKSYLNEMRMKPQSIRVRTTVKSV